MRDLYILNGVLPGFIRLGATDRSIGVEISEDYNLIPFVDGRERFSSKRIYKWIKLKRKLEG